MVCQCLVFPSGSFSVELKRTVAVSWSSEPELPWKLCININTGNFQFLSPSTPILGINPTLYTYEDGTASKFRNVGTKSSDARRLPKRHNTAFNTRRKFGKEQR